MKDRINEDGTETTIESLLKGMLACWLSGRFCIEDFAELYDMSVRDAQSYLEMAIELTENKRRPVPLWLVKIGV